MAGGTPNAARLLKNFPGWVLCARYFVGWVTVPAVHNAIILRLDQDEPRTLGIACPETILKIGFSSFYCGV